MAYKKPSVVPGLWDGVSVAHIENPGLFTVRLTGSETDFFAIMTQIQKDCASSKAPASNTSVGSPILAKFGFDNQWYRSQVTGVNDDGSLEVHYVDYGNKDRVNKAETRSIADKYLELPIQGVNCRMNRIDFTQSLKPADHENFCMMVLNQNFTAKFVEYSPSSDVWLVELLHKTGNVNDWLGKKAGTLNAVAHVTPPANIPHPHNAGKIAEKPATNGHSSPARSSSVFATQRVEVPMQFTGAVVFSNGPVQFWIHKDSDADALATMSEELAEYCASSAAVNIQNPTTGQVCAALYSSDGSWYRGKIADTKPGYAEVYFSDYGNTEWVENGSIIKLPAKLQTLPGFAIEASVFGLQPVGGAWSNDACARFGDLVMADSCNVEVVDETISKVAVSITVQGQSPAMMLINEGHGVLQTGDAVVANVKEGVFKSPGYKSQQVIEAMCVFLKSPQEFYCQPIATNAELDELMNEIATKYVKDVPTLANITTGAPCCALYSQDGGWYRAQVVENHGDKVKVFFVDYGNIDELDKTSIRELLPGLLDLPPQAIHCTLFDASPASGQAWSPEAVQAFEQLIMSESVESVMLKVIERQGQCYSVSVTVGSDDVKDKLQSGGFAAQDMVKVTPIPSTSRAAGSSSSQSSLSAYKDQSVDTGQAVDVFISWLLHPGAFWVQKAGCEPILEELGVTAQQCATNSRVLTNPTPKATCLAKYPVDDFWYRGQIVSCEGQHCSVLFVDYGNTEKIPHESIYQVPSSLLSTPTQAFKCSLLGIKPCSGDEWSTESHNLMEKLMAEGGACTFIAKHNDTYLVDLTYGQQENLSDALINGGVAKASKSSSQASDRSHGSHRSTGSVRQPRQPSGAGDASVTTPQHSSHSEAQTKIPPCSPSSFGLNAGDGFEAFICHIESPQEFYVQSVLMKDKLDTLYDLMGQHYKSSTALSVAVPKIGLAYVVQFSEDNEWYRARVDTLEGDRVEVFYLDYGNKEWTEKCKLRHIGVEYASLPAQALRCSLHGAGRNVAQADKQAFKNEFTFATHQCLIASVSGASVALDIRVDGASLGFRYQDPEPQTTYKYSSNQETAGQFTGYVVYEDGNMIYVQKSENAELIDNTMANVATEAGNSKQLTSIDSGVACLAKFTDDNEWYRGEVMTISRDQCNIYFVDYGNQGNVLFADILEISKSLAEIPPLAIRCKVLGDADPVSVTDWSNGDEVTVDVKTVMNGVPAVELTNMDGKKRPDPESRNSNQTASPSSHKAATPNRPVKIRLPPVELAPGRYDAYLSHVERPNQFYIQLTADSDQLDKIMAELQPLGPQAEPEVYCPAGQACVAKYTADQAWYRAEVMAAEENEGTTVIRFVDYGNTETVRNSDLKVIPISIRNYRPIAIECTADDPALLAMSLEDIQAMYSERELCVEVCNDTPPFCVKLHDGALTTGSCNPEGIKPTNCPPTICDPIQLRYADAPVAVSPASRSVVVSHMENPGAFYCQFGSEDELNSIAEILFDVYTEGFSSRLLPVDACKPGQPCVAQFSDDEQWYRAVIISANNPQKCKVLFIDFGNSEEVPVEKICSLTPELAVFPKQAMPCKGHGIYPLAGTEWDVEATSRLNDLVNRDDLMATVLSINNSEVCTVTLNCSDGEIFDIMSEAKFTSRNPSTGQPVSELCEELFSQIIEVLGESADKMTQLVTELIPSFDKHLTEMDEGSDDANTVQDIIRYVLSNILASITGSPLESRTIIVADKKALGVEISLVVETLLEHVGDMTSRIVDQALNVGASSEDVNVEATPSHTPQADQQPQVMGVTQLDTPPHQFASPVSGFSLLPVPLTYSDTHHHSYGDSIPAALDFPLTVSPDERVRNLAKVARNSVVKACAAAAESVHSGNCFRKPTEVRDEDIRIMRGEYQPRARPLSESESDGPRVVPIESNRIDELLVSTTLTPIRSASAEPSVERKNQTAMESAAGVKDKSEYTVSDNLPICGLFVTKLPLTINIPESTIPTEPTPSPHSSSNLLLVEHPTSESVPCPCVEAMQNEQDKLVGPSAAPTEIPNGTADCIDSTCHSLDTAIELETNSESSEQAAKRDDVSKGLQTRTDLCGATVEIGLTESIINDSLTSENAVESVTEPAGNEVRLSLIVQELTATPTQMQLPKDTAVPGSPVSEPRTCRTRIQDGPESPDGESENSQNLSTFASMSTQIQFSMADAVTEGLLPVPIANSQSPTEAVECDDGLKISQSSPTLTALSTEHCRKGIFDEGSLPLSLVSMSEITTETSHNALKQVDDTVLLPSIIECASSTPTIDGMPKPMERSLQQDETAIVDSRCGELAVEVCLETMSCEAQKSSSSGLVNYHTRMADYCEETASGDTDAETLVTSLSASVELPLDTEATRKDAMLFPSNSVIPGAENEQQDLAVKTSDLERTPSSLELNSEERLADRNERGTEEPADPMMHSESTGDGPVMCSDVVVEREMPQSDELTTFGDVALSSPDHCAASEQVSDDHEESTSPSSSSFCEDDIILDPPTGPSDVDDIIDLTGSARLSRPQSSTGLSTIPEETETPSHADVSDCDELSSEELLMINAATGEFLAAVNDQHDDEVLDIVIIDEPETSITPGDSVAPQTTGSTSKQSEDNTVDGPNPDACVASGGHKEGHTNESPQAVNTENLCQTPDEEPPIPATELDSLNNSDAFKSPMNSNAVIPDSSSHSIGDAHTAELGPVKADEVQMDGSGDATAEMCSKSDQI